MKQKRGSKPATGDLGEAIAVSTVSNSPTGKAPPVMPVERLLTVGQIAQAYQLSRSTIARMVKAGQIPALRFGEAIRFRPSRVIEAIERLNGKGK